MSQRQYPTTANTCPETADGTRAGVLELLEQWRSQTVAESEALRALNWPAVRACHRAKEELQALLLPQLGSAPGGTEDQLRPVVEGLLALEARNRDWLAERRAALSARRLELNDSARNLQRVRNSYARLDASRWESYG
jgi:hypothetical protein